MRSETSAAAPLAGLMVVDLTRVLAGPYATQILADYGAQVIKVEPPGGDETRFWGPPFVRDADRPHPQAAYYQGLNRNKAGLALDLRQPAGREVLLRLLAKADILMENFKPGTLERWGLAPDTLKEKVPRLIHGRISGFGPEGPLAGQPGYDAVIQAMSGLMAMTGNPDSGPVRIGASIVDMVAGLNLLSGVLMALHRRHITGGGGTVEVALFDAALAIAHPAAANWLADGRDPAPMGTGHPNIYPYDLFPTRTGPVFLGIGNDRQFARAMALLGKPDMAQDPRFATNSARSRNREALRPVLEALLAQWDGAQLAEDMLAAGIPAGPLQTVGQALSSPQANASGSVLEAEGYRGVASAIRYGGARPGVTTAPPGFAADRDSLLTELGYAPEDIAALARSGAVPGPETDSA